MKKALLLMKSSSEPKIHFNEIVSQQGDHPFNFNILIKVKHLRINHKEHGSSTQINDGYFHNHFRFYPPKLLKVQYT